VTSALGAAAAAEIPLTHRKTASAVVLITAHRASASDAVDWSKFAGSGATLVIYMPGQDYADVAGSLIAAGFAREMPCAVVSQATTRRQRVHRTTIAGLHHVPELAAPTLLVVGEVVRFSDPAVFAQEFVPPHFDAEEQALHPFSLLKSVSSRARNFEGNEEPIA